MFVKALVKVFVGLIEETGLQQELQVLTWCSSVCLQELVDFTLFMWTI